MRSLVRHLRAHSRLVLAAACGSAVAWLVPSAVDWRTRALIGWDAAVWLYLGSVAWAMFRSDPGRLQQRARAQAESALAVLVLATIAATASFGAVVFEVGAAKAPGTSHPGLHLALALAAIAGSWLLLPTLFALNYASRYHDDDDDGGDDASRAGRPARRAAGLQFPGIADGELPDHGDFLYFAFTIAVASQTSDVTISTRPMRRLVLLQSLLSFGFNTTVLAFAINIAASLL